MAIQSRLRTLLLSAFFILYPSIVEYAHALTDWSISDVSECGSLDVTFTGRNGTIIMFIVPTDQNVNGPLEWYAADTNFTSPISITPFQHKAGSQFIFALFDEDDPPKNLGVTDIQTVQPSSNTTCTSQPPPGPETDFFFSLNNSAPATCDTMHFNWSDTFIAPGYIFTFEVGKGAQRGDISVSDPIDVSGAGGMDLRVNLEGASTFAVVMTDNGTTGLGGSSTLMTVRTGGDTSCLDSSTTTTTDPFMPVSIITQIETKTAVAPGFTDGNSNGNDSTKNDGQASSKKSNTGTIAGIAGGAAGAVLLIALLAFFFVRRKRQQSRPFSGDLTGGDGAGRQEDKPVTTTGGGLIVPFLSPEPSSGVSTASPPREDLVGGSYFAEKGGNRSLPGASPPQASEDAYGNSMPLSPEGSSRGGGNGARYSPLSTSDPEMSSAVSNAASMGFGIARTDDTASSTSGGPFASPRSRLTSPPSHASASSSGQMDQQSLSTATTPPATASTRDQRLVSKYRESRGISGNDGDSQGVPEEEGQVHETIVRHSDAGGIARTAPSRNSVVHLPPAYDEAVSARRGA